MSWADDSTLKAVRVDDSSKTMHDDPPTPFFGLILEPVATVHLFLRKVTVVILKPRVVGGK